MSALSDNDTERGVTGKSEKNFSILVCVDGSTESDRALRYALRLGSGTDADLTLLYVRPIDQGLRTAGLQFSVARENLLDWGIELPGMKVLKTARDQLVELGLLSDGTQEEFKHTDVVGDPLGDNMIIYSTDSGRTITLKLMVAPSIVHGILDESDLGEYDITIIARADSHDGTGLGFIDPRMAEDIALEHSGTVLIAHELEESHGHLVCVKDDQLSIEAARRDAEIASRCACPVFLYSVASDETELESANRAIARARRAIEEVGIQVSGDKVEIGDPVEKIVEEGRSYSVIVLSAPTKKKGWRRLFAVSVANKVLESAHNSVMIAR